MKSTMTTEMPIEGPAYIPSRPETRQPWLDFRRPGITATQIRDWGIPNRRRKIVEEKVTGEFEDLSSIPYVAHGTLREPIIAAWVHGRYGIAPCDSVFASARNSRHLASPDGVSLDPFTGQLIVGTADAILSEIKTSKHDLTPGSMTDDRTLVYMDEESHFARTGYYLQMQWQMYVMNSPMTLFVWEQHDNIVDPETGTFTPVGPPQIAWIPRNEAIIRILVDDVAPKALAEIDAARAAVLVEDLPPASELPSEHAILVAELLKARSAEAAAKAAKAKAWKALEAHYLAEGAPDTSIDAGFARVTVSTTEKLVRRPNMERARKRAPKLVAQYEALVERYTEQITTSNRTLTITESKKENPDG